MIRLTKEQVDIIILLQRCVREINNPTIYTRNLGEIIYNTYSNDSHPNDKRNSYKKGQSKGRMIGLEEAGWIGYITDSI